MTLAVIDAHAHVWTQDRARYPFGPLKGLSAPRDVRTPAQFEDDCGDEPVAGVLLIQPRVYGYDHTYVYDAATKMSRCARVMPLIDAANSYAPSALRGHARSSMTAGFRVIALGPDSAEWLCSSVARRLWEVGAELNLPVGFLIDPNQLRVVEQVAEAHPKLDIVIDHLARCVARDRDVYGSSLCALIERPNVYVKISAIDTLSRSCFPHRDMWPLVHALYNVAGARKLLWGSDWPHNMVDGAYRNSRAAVGQALFDAPESDLEAIFGTTAARLFGFDMDITMAGATDDDT